MWHFAVVALAAAWFLAGPTRSIPRGEAARDVSPSPIPKPPPKERP